MKLHFWVVLALSLVSAGCAAKRYSEFTGYQHWPTQRGTMADSAYAVPVYHGWPERPYRVIGSIQFAENYHEWKDGDTAHAAMIAKSKGADAMIMRSGGEFGVGAIAGAAADPLLIRSAMVSALAIKWKTQGELDAEANALETFRTRFKAAHPAIELKDELLATGVEYIASLGLKIDSPEGAARLERDLNDIFHSAGKAGSSKWLFKAVFQSNALTSSSTQYAYGVATMAQTGENLTIVSTSGKADINFNGTAKDGRMNGNIGVSAGTTIFSAKAEGVLVPDKISLNSQGQTANGVVEGSLTFLR